MEFSGIRVLCIGDVMIDRFLLGRVDRISPEAPVPVLQLERSRSTLGGAGNVARNIIALGGEAVLCGLIGTDAGAEELKALISGVNGITDATVRSGSRRTTCKSRIVALHQQVIRIDEELALPAQAQEITALHEAIVARIADVQAVILSDYGKGVVVSEITGYVIRLARERGLSIFVDPKCPDFTRYSGATCITPNFNEFAAAAGYVPDTEDAIAEAARKLSLKANADAILVTRSENGMTLVTRDGLVSSVQSRALDVFDVSGAGDTAIATFALACACGETMPKAMRIANAAAGIVVGKSGTATVSPEELAHALEEGIRPEALFPSQALTARPKAAKLARQWRNAGLKVGFTNGCFDILHAGHVSLLKQARIKCDRLIVGLNTDASVARLKGPGRPVNSLEDRASVLSSLRYVDLVVAFVEDTPRALIEELKPDILVKGADYAADKVVGADVVEANGGSVFLADLVAERSTTSLISRIRNSLLE